MKSIIRPDMHGKVALVTGGTSGIGKATASALATFGANVLVVGRNRTQGESAVADIKKQSGNSAVEFLQVDLSSQAAVQQLVQQFTTHHSQLHILVNNAGGIFSQRTVTTDGIEMTFAINYLTPFLLTQLLLPTMRASAPARVVNISSNLHRLGTIQFDNLQGSKNYRGLRGAYAQSKLAVLLFTYELARQLEGTGVTVNAVDPGSVKTNVYRNSTGMLALMGKAGTPFYTSAEQGAQSSIYAASASELEGISGRYYSSKAKEIRSSNSSYDEAAAKRLWQISLQLTRLSVNVSQ